MIQSFTFIDPAGDAAQYMVFDAGRDMEYRWSTETVIAAGTLHTLKRRNGREQPSRPAWRRGADQLRETPPFDDDGRLFPRVLGKSTVLTGVEERV